MEQIKTGYPSVDRPWLAYYPADAAFEKADKDTLYSFVTKRNQDNLAGIALDYFGTKITYGQLFSEINAAAKSFVSLCVKPGDIVSLVVLSSPQAFIAIYALNKIGAVANIIEPRTNAAQIIDRINATKSEVSLIVENIYEKIKDEMPRCSARDVIVYSLADSMRRGMKLAYCAKYGRSKVPCSRHLIGWKSFMALGACADAVPPVPFAEKSPAVIVYTGGTTGMAKGAVLPNEAFTLMHYCKAVCDPPFERGQTFLGIMPPFIAYGMMFGFFMALSFGCTVAIVPVFEPAKFDSLILKYRPNHFFGVPSFFEGLTSGKLMKKADLSCIRGIITGGDYMSPQTEMKINAFLASHNCSAKIYKGYGMTELSSAAVYTGCEKSNVPGSIGIPLVLNQVKIIHPESGKELPYGEHGELCISSPTMMLGYYNNPAETDEIIRYDENGVAWVHTQDIGYMKEDGTLYIIGRRKRMIVRPDGHNVWPSVIENIINMHDSVSSCAVVGLPNPAGDSGRIPTAFVELRPNVKQSNEQIAEQLDAMCRKALPERDIPWAYRFCKQLPLSSVGKIDYRKLEELANI